MKRKKSWYEIEDNIKILVDKVRGFNPEIILACMRGGMIPAILIAEEFKILDIFPLDIERKGDKRKIAYKISNLNLKNKRVLVVEDDVYSGKSLLKAKEFVENEEGICKTCALYVWEDTPNPPDFDFGIYKYENMPDYPHKKSRHNDRYRIRNGVKILTEDEAYRK